MNEAFNFQKEHQRGRRSYIIFILLSMMVPFISAVVYAFSETAEAGTSIESVLAFASLLALILSLIVWYLWFIVTVQRLNDAGMSAKWSLLYIIPLLGHILAFYLFLIPSKDMEKNGNDKLLLVLFKLWNGNERLHVAFWYVFVPVIAIQYLVGTPSSLLAQILMLAVVLYSYVTVWRCAPNHKGAIPWWFLARALIGVRIAMNIYILVDLSNS